MLTRYLKNWMQKNKDKWPFNHLSWKKWTHSLMKQSISRPNAPCTSMAIRIKWCPSWSLLYLQILTMVLNFAITFASQLMTFVGIVSCVKLITTTSATKIWFSWVMWRLTHNKTFDVKVYHHYLHTLCPFSWARAYMTSLMASCLAIR